jgi:iron complex outermembrane receptor protein
LPALKQLTIEELLELDVMLPLRRDERVIEAPSAIALLTSEDIRRQGAVSLPEALRMLPAMQVSRFNASSWVISSRGFASTSANKMLVMIDGRSVYSPLFSGVFWDQQDTMLADIDRIEVVRGPGASLWGSNAVNGVINVVSKRASDTQGTLVSLSSGAEEQFASAIRHGGRAGHGHYRVYGQFFKRDSSELSDGSEAEDGRRFGQAGFRMDVGETANAFTLQGDVYASRVDFAERRDIEAGGVNLLGRWTRQWSASSALEIQGYIDTTHRDVPDQFDEERVTVDLDAQHQWKAATRHAVTVGGGYRHSGDDTTASPLLAFAPEDRATDLFTGFAQDEIAIAPNVTAIAGVKLEHNDYTGVEWQPSARVRWLPSRTQTLWGAVSRAVRMPTRLDTDVQILHGNAVIIRGNPDFRSESVVAYEVGYRASPASIVAFDLTAFINRYDDLRTQEPIGGQIMVGNGLNDRSVGGNITATVQPRPWVRLTGSYTRLSHDLSLDPGSRDVAGGRLETIDPSYIARFIARFDAPRGLELDGGVLFVAGLPQPNPAVPATPAYQEANFRIGWRITDRVELALIGRDVLHDSHVEFISPTSSRITRIERALYTRMSIAFR